MILSDFSKINLEPQNMIKCMSIYVDCNKKCFFLKQLSSNYLFVQIPMSCTICNDIPMLFMQKERKQNNSCAAYKASIR